MSQHPREAEGSLTEEVLGRAGSSPDNDGTDWVLPDDPGPASKTERCNESESVVEPA